MTDQNPTASYQPPERMLMMSAEQAGVFNEKTRVDIMMMLAERPASTKQLAEAMGKPKGTIGHHLKALEEAELIAIVGTRQIRAITEKFYGRLARTYVFPDLDDRGEKGHGFIGEVLHEVRMPSEDEASMITLRHARIPHDRATEFAAEMLKVAEEFAAEERGGETVYGFIVGVYPTDRPALREDEG
jgi:DNA-binding transcriptional ArsR family regulator